jgi:hypothetical protein
MQIKTTLRFHLNHIRIQTTTNSGEDAREKGILIYCWWEYKLVHHYGKQYGDALKI